MIVVASLIVSVVFPFLDLVGYLLSALCGPAIMFGIPSFYLLRGKQKLGSKLGTVDALLTRTLIYLVTPVFTFFGVAWVIVQATHRYSTAAAFL